MLYTTTNLSKGKIEIITLVFKKNDMKNIFFTLLLLLCCNSLSAKRTIVTTATEINNKKWIAGDTIVIKNGTWTDQVITLKANGTADQPIVLLAETAGKVLLNGTSRLAFSGQYIEISGLYFKNGTLSGSDVISFRTSSSELATNCKLINSAIANYNPIDNMVDNKWISLYGTNNVVDQCSFENKNNSGTLLVVWLQSGVTVNHIISNNYFGYRNSNLDSSGKELNGQEIIRIGDSNTSMTTAAVTVEGNFFEKCNGEIEIISNKSCGNIYRNNLFLECEGMLTLRHGNDCIVDGNYFFGNGVPESGGIRIIGENHMVYNNYFEKLRGSGYRAALCMVRGKENSALSEYFQVKNTLVAFNTMVDCSQSFNINYNSSSTCTLPPINSIIAHNHIYNSTTSYTNVNIEQTNVSSMDVSWKNNLMNQGKYSNFYYTSMQVITEKDAKMTLVGTTTNMYEPTFGSALLNYATSEYNNIILMDIRGRNRENTTKLPGSSQLLGILSRTMPSKTAVGASFFSNPNTGIHLQSESTEFSISVQNNQIISEITESGLLNIFDITGKCVFQHILNQGVSKIALSKKGIYILRFRSNNGNQAIKKIIY